MKGAICDVPNPVYIVFGHQAVTKQLAHKAQFVKEPIKLALVVALGKTVRIEHEILVIQLVEKVPLIILSEEFLVQFKDKFRPGGSFLDRNPVVSNDKPDKGSCTEECIQKVLCAEVLGTKIEL